MKSTQMTRPAERLQPAADLANITTMTKPDTDRQASSPDPSAVVDAPTMAMDQTLPVDEVVVRTTPYGDDNSEEVTARMAAQTRALQTLWRERANIENHDSINATPSNARNLANARPWRRSNVVSRRR